MKKFIIYNLKPRISEKGIASLAAVLILGGFIVEIALVGVALAYLLTGTNLGIRLSAEALAAAQGGIEDGIIHVIRSDYVNQVPYAVPATGNAAVSVVINGPVCITGAQQVTVTADASALSKHRKLQAVLSVDCMTRLVKVSSVQEITI